MSSKKMSGVMCVGVLIALLLGACAPAAPVAPTAEPQVVEVTKIVAGTPVVEQVIVTATPEPTVNPYDDSAPIKVWVDAERGRQVQAFIEKFPEKGKLISLINDDTGLLQSKVLLWNNVGQGWADVTFAGAQQYRTMHNTQYDFFAADLTDWIDPEIVKNLYPGVNDSCVTPDGKLICIRNDIAPNLMFYNAPKLKEFGYEVPKTWEDFEALAVKVAKEHPGYTMGELDSWEPQDMWYRGAECPVMEPVTTTSFRVNMNHPNCQRMTAMLDRLNALGVMDRNGYWSAGYIDKWKTDQWLFHFGPAWLPDFVIKGVYLDATDEKNNEKVGVALWPNYADQATRYTGSVGGGSYAMSRHTKNPKLAAELIAFVTTDPEVGKVQASTPAYMPSAQLWGAGLLDRVPQLAKLPDPWAVMNEANATFWSESQFEGPPISVKVFGPFFTDVAAGKKTVADVIPDLQKALEEDIAKAGYEVITTGP
jgi:ABC-type glycerol-3-phosphate transport system substrate-binding protein